MGSGSWTVQCVGGDRRARQSPTGDGSSTTTARTSYFEKEVKALRERRPFPCSSQEGFSVGAMIQLSLVGLKVSPTINETMNFGPGLYVFLILYFPPPEAPFGLVFVFCFVFYFSHN